MSRPALRVLPMCASRRLPRGGTEDAHQRALMQWADRAQHAPGMAALALLHHIPNGGKRGKIEAARFKAMGVKAGVPDLHLPAPRRGYAGCYLEMKSETGRVSKEQRWWIRRLRNLGNAVAVCRHWSVARAVLEYYLGVTDEEPSELREVW